MLPDKGGCGFASKLILDASGNLTCEYVDGQGYTFPLYFDEDQTAVVAYDIAAVPASFFIDDFSGKEKRLIVS